MCGICGIINFSKQKVEEQNLLSMMQKMKHRGPDDEGSYVNSNIGLGHVRLSIIDLSVGGHQPMLDETENFVLSYNGEIYNYIELRAELKQKGHSFRTSSDSEVLLKAYIEWGEQCLDRLNGMFAFAIFNKSERSVFLARDRYGIKPFYYYKDNERLLFASELPAILSVIKSKAKNSAIANFLVHNRHDYNHETFFEGIVKLPHGHCITIKERKVIKWRWYNLSEKLNRKVITPEQYKHLFTNAVSLRLRSDVPVGVCLSGGIDSSAITSILLKTLGIHDVNTFSAVYGSAFDGDESEFINAYRNDLENMHFITPTGESLLSDLPNLLETHAEPFSTTTIYAQYRVMELASKNVKVLLDGQGADEYLAGYHYFFGYHFAQMVKEFRWLSLINEVFKYVKTNRSNYGIKVAIMSLLPQRILPRIEEKTSGISLEYYKQYYSKSKEISKLAFASNLKSSLLNHFEHKLEHLLKWEDLNSMRFSIESRTPFLDYRLVETIMSQKADKLIKQGTTKYIFREAMKGILPEDIRQRKDKIGFQTPSDNWFRENNFKSFIFDLLTSSAFKNRGIIDQQTAINYYNMHLEKKINISKSIWKWVSLELWYRNYIDN
jgi:asparagine synthase (glutamine-hydrolysing)